MASKRSQCKMWHAFVQRNMKEGLCDIRQHSSAVYVGMVVVVCML